LIPADTTCSSPAEQELSHHSLRCLFIKLLTGRDHNITWWLRGCSLTSHSLVQPSAEPERRNKNQIFFFVIHEKKQQE
jgi:hypothetical protein